MHLAEATWTDAAAADADLAVLPVGSTEQHGPHAPLGTDTFAAEAVAAGAAADADRDVAVAPAVPVGVAEEHRDFAGTLWVREDAFRAYVGDVLESLAAQGVERIVVVNGHGGNVDALREVAARLTREEVAYVVPFTWFDAVDLDDLEGDLDGASMGHGGAVETSLLLATRPDLVREDRLVAAADGAAERWGEWVAGTNLAYDTAAFSESGVVGDPTAADADVGEALLDAARASLVALFDAVATREWRD